MEQISFVFTIFFMLLGPVKLIPAFGGLTQDMDGPFKRRLAILGVVIASALCAFVALAGGALLDKYHISINAVRLAGGLVLMIAALQATFRKAQAFSPVRGTPSAIQVATSPLAVPNIVPPAGVAAILIFLAYAPQYPDMVQAVTICLSVVMVLDFLVMFFIDVVIKTPGLPIILTVIGSVLVFVQICLAVQMMLAALQDLGMTRA